MKKCEVCGETEAKYRCPRCEMETCCLQCVSKHKTDRDCSGHRDKTAYIATKNMRDINLLSDYRFLEDAGRKNNNASRDILKRKHFQPKFVKDLERQATERKIDLRLMPYPMTRRKNNCTTYNYKSKSILWQVEWIFPQADFTVIDQRIDETTLLADLLARHTGPEADPMTRHKLRPYLHQGQDKWRVLMKVQYNTTPEERYHQLDIDKSITENLANRCIVEYPTIYVVLEQCWAQYVLEEKKEEIPNEESSSGSDSSEQTDSECNKDLKDFSENNLKSQKPPDKIVVCY